MASPGNPASSTPADTGALARSSRAEATSIAELLEQAQIFAERARAAATHRAYASDWADFAVWCEARHRAALPATPETIAAYISDLANQRRLKNTTIQRRLAAISQIHQLAGHPSPTKDGRVKEVWKGMRRSPDRQRIREATAAELAILQRMVATLEPPRGEDPIVSQRLQVIRARDRALLLFGFTGGFRRSELVALDVEDISEDEHGLVALVRRSKNDPEGEGLEKVIPYGSSLATCPVRAWRAWLAVSQISSGPAFRGVDRHGRVGTARTGRPGQPDGRLTSDAVSRIIKRCARQAGYDPERFSGHSLRAGFVTTAAERGATEAEIMEQTGHKTERMVRRYIRRGTRWSNPAAAKLGL